MRPSNHTYLVFFLTLISALLLAGCVSKPKPVGDKATPVPEMPAESAVKLPEMEFQAGDKAYPEGYYVHTVQRAQREHINHCQMVYRRSEKLGTVGKM